MFTINTRLLIDDANFYWLLASTVLAMFGAAFVSKALGASLVYVLFCIALAFAGRLSGVAPVLAVLYAAAVVLAGFRV